MSNRPSNFSSGRLTNDSSANVQRDLRVAAVFLVVVPLACHLLFSWMGFSPTDDGFTLAYSRRIIDGQIPHRDFITIRPFLSPLMHVLFVLFGGAYTLWWSRLFVWIELASIAWLWSAILQRALVKRLKPGEQACAALITFMLCAHEYPIMAWHTVDGLLLASLGLAFCARPGTRLRIPGYVLLGMSYLCKQSFLFLAPAVLLILNDWRQVKYWAAALVPALVYMAFLLAAGAFQDGLLQLTAQHDLWPVGIVSFLTGWTLPGLLLGGSYALLSSPQWAPRFLRDSRAQAGLHALFFTSIVLLASLSLAAGMWMQLSFGAFGMAAAVVLPWFTPTRLTPIARIWLLALVFAWSVSLSIGYNTPVLASGVLFILLALHAAGYFHGGAVQPLHFALGIATIALALAFVFNRETHIFEEQPAFALTHDLGTVLRGGSGIRTNANTYAMLGDLRNAMDEVQRSGKRIVVLPGPAAYWITAEQANPLPIDWAQGIELSQPALMSRVTDSLRLHADQQVVILEKFDPAWLAYERVPIEDPGFYGIVAYVRAHSSMLSETEFFELRQMQSAE